MSILDKIIKHKEKELDKSLGENPSYPRSYSPRGFKEALAGKSSVSSTRPAVIAEVKKASPSKGVIEPNFEPVAKAKAHAAGGASALSVLTDEEFFQGHLSYLSKIREELPEMPLLRKDFIIDPRQLSQSVEAGADAILLIVSVLSLGKLEELYQGALELGLDCLIEVHTREELNSLLSLELDSDRTLVGVNNRNLDTFETSLEVSRSLAKEFKHELSSKNLALVSESGISSREEVDSLREIGFSAFLLGESVMRDPELLGSITREE